MPLIHNILVRGSNDIASAVAYILYLAGYGVAIHESPTPTTTRRKMAFADAVFDGRAVLENVEAIRIDRLVMLRNPSVFLGYIPIVTKDFDRLLKILRPLVLVDARMRKHAIPENQCQLAHLTIGLGPNFIAGENVHIAIETGWGENLGKVITQGATDPLAGEPKSIEGHARDRYVYAPCAGKFETPLQIGDPVVQGQVIAHIEGTSLCAPISGFLRGLTHNGVKVKPKTKVIEVDPRDENPQISGIAERPRKIAQGVLSAIQLWEQSHSG